MKIHRKKNESIRQFDCIKITCADGKMIAMLGLSPTNSAPTLQYVQEFRAGKHSYFEWMFRSGAKLKLDDKVNRWYIYCYSAGGGDGREAMDELKMLYALYRAQKHADRMNKRSFPKTAPKLRVRFDYGTVGM